MTSRKKKKKYIKRNIKFWSRIFSLGRQKSRYEDNIKIVLSKLAGYDEDWIKSYKDVLAVFML